MILLPDSLIHGRYRIVRLIGRGGMGAVYEAIDERLGSTIALKQTLMVDNALLNAGSDVDSQYIATLRKAFEREARLLAKLRHPTLPKVMDYFSDDQGQFLVMEFIPGDDLAMMLNRRQTELRYATILKWTDQLLDALDYLHTQPNPIIHRDIKPQNLKLTPRNEIILLDFGLAKGSTSLHTRVSTMASIYGYTQQYAPLEQIRGTGTDPRSDLYALSATVYHLLTLKLPADALARIDALFNRAPDPLKPIHELNAEVPPAVSDVFMQGLAISVSDRPESAAAFRVALQAALQQPGLASVPPTVLPPTIVDAHTGEPEHHATVAYVPPVSQPPPAGSVAVTPEANTLMQGEPTAALTTDPARYGGIPPAAWAVASVPGSGVPLPPLPTPVPTPPPGRSRTYLTIGGIIAVVLVVLAVILINPNLSIASLFDRIDTSTPSANNVGATTGAAGVATTSTAAVEQTATAIAAESTAAAAQTAVAEQTAIAIAAAAAMEQTATAVVEATAQALAEQRAAIAADSSTRAVRHRSGELGDAAAQYDRPVEAALLQNGYRTNVIAFGGRRGLQPSPFEPTRHTWVRDLDYASSGYGYVLGDMSVLRENIELFLDDVEPNGIVPDVYNAQSGYGLNQAWDSMPNLIQAIYTYVAKTGDRDFYRTHRQRCQWIGGWIVQLDTDGDGLPDRDVFPYGYYNSIRNSVRHTYALAKFYAAFNQLAELEQAIGEDGSAWAQRAAGLRAAFHRPADEGGYWMGDLAWPAAWRNPGEAPSRTLETFGVFEALRSGLIAPTDERYPELMTALNARLPDLMIGPFPMRLALSGYPPGSLRDVVREPWKIDASAPWIVGLAVPAYAHAGNVEAANTLLQAYTAAAAANEYLVPQLVAVDGSGREGRGGAWGSSAWFMAVYGGHYGLTMTPEALIVQPYPFRTIPDDGVQNFSYQGAVLQLTLDVANQTYRLRTDRATIAILRPIGQAAQLQVNDGPLRAEELVILQPDQEYVVVSR